MVGQLTVPFLQGRLWAAAGGAARNGVLLRREARLVQEVGIRWSAVAQVIVRLPERVLFVLLLHRQHHGLPLARLLLLLLACGHCFTCHLLLRGRDRGSRRVGVAELILFCSL